MSDLVVRTYGTGEFTAEVFNAVAATINSPEFNVVLSGTFLISLVIATYQFSKVKDITIIAKNIFMYVGVIALLLVPKYTVTVKDDILGNHYGVANVPLGLAAPAYLITNTFYGLTRLVEITFHWADDHNYSKTGYLFASQIVKDASKVKILNPNLNKSLQSFLSQCVMYDLYLGFYTLNDLLRSDNIWSVISSNASKNRAFLLNNEVTMCNKGATILSKEFEEELDNTFTKYAKIILPGVAAQNTRNEDIKNKLIASVKSSYGYLTGVAQGGADILKQNILINAIQDAALDNPELGMYSYAVTRANAQKVVANTSTGLMMTRWLPIMAGTMETMIYALFMLVVIYALFADAGKVFANYVKTMAWIASWPVVFAILNFGFTWAIKLKSSGAGMSFYDSGYLVQTQFDMSSMFGYFLLAVPFISWGMLNLANQGLGSVFTQMSQLIGSSSQSLAMAASSEAVTGNMQMANTSFDNHSMFNTSTFKHDSNMNYQSGSISTQLPSGSTITRMSDDTSVLNMEPGISRLNTGINLSEKLSASATEQADKSFSAAKSDQTSWAENMSSAMRNLYDVGHNINTSTSSGDSFSVNKSGGYAQAATDYSSAIDKFAHDNNLSKQDAGRLLRGAYLNGSAHLEFGTDKQIIGKFVELASGTSGGTRVSTGLKFEGDHSWTSQDAENYVKAHEYIKQNNLTETFDKAVKGIEEQRYQTDNRDNINLTEGMNASFDKAKQSSKSFSSHIQESQNYRELASYSNEYSTSINTNANQDFLKFVASKPITTGSSAMGINQAEVLLRSDPKLRNAYAEEFIVEKTQSSFNNWKQSNMSKEGIQNFANESSNEINSKNASLESNYTSHKAQLMKSKMGQELNNIKIDESIKNQVKSEITNASNSVEDLSNQTNNFGKNLQQNVQAKVKDNVDVQSNFGKAYDLVTGNGKKEDK